MLVYKTLTLLFSQVVWFLLLRNSASCHKYFLLRSLVLVFILQKFDSREIISIGRKYVGSYSLSSDSLQNSPKRILLALPFRKISIIKNFVLVLQRPTLNLTHNLPFKFYRYRYNFLNSIAHDNCTVKRGKQSYLISTSTYCISELKDRWRFSFTSINTRR